MHELALTENLVEILRQQAASQGFTAVRRVILEIGLFSNVEPEAITFCFGVATRGTLAEGAVLEIVRPPGRGYCPRCRQQVTVTVREQACPDCGQPGWLLIGGEELRVTELEVV